MQIVRYIRELGDQYKVDDHELIVSAYKGFLTAASQHTQRLNASTVSRSVIRVLGIPSKQALDFGEAMSRSMAYVALKGRQSTSGKKLTPVVKAILQNWVDDTSTVILPEPAPSTPPQKRAKLQEGDVVTSPTEIAKIYCTAPTTLQPKIHAMGTVEISSDEGTPLKEPQAFTALKHTWLNMFGIKLYIYIYISYILIICDTPLEELYNHTYVQYKMPCSHMNMI